jgi:hypothetical protein
VKNPESDGLRGLRANRKYSMRLWCSAMVGSMRSLRSALGHPMEQYEQELGRFNLIPVGRASMKRRQAYQICKIPSDDASTRPRRQRHHARSPLNTPYVRHGEPRDLQGNGRDPVAARRQGYHWSQRIRVIRRRRIQQAGGSIRPLNRRRTFEVEGDPRGAAKSERK